MDYEEKYKDAIKRAEAVIKVAQNQKEVYGCAVTIFPELEESEDERIRKELISIVKSYRESCITEGNHRFDDCIAWLEKQGEQKTAWSEKDEEMRKKLLFLMEEENKISSWGGCYEWLKSIMR